MSVRLDDSPGTAEEVDEARARITRLQAVLGDPDDPANPLGHAAVLTADQRSCRAEAGLRLLDDHGLNTELVPAALGGRLDSLETMVRVLRQVSRRDVALGISFGSTFMATSDVCLAGSAEQQRWIADVVLGGARATIAQHETAHGNDYVRSGVRIRFEPDRFVLNGLKTITNNMPDVGALVLFCTEPDSRSHTVLLMDPAEFPAEHYRVVPRPRTVAMRSALMEGMAFDECPVPASTLLGRRGEGMELALRSFQLSRSVMSSLVLGAGEVCLRTAADFSRVEGTLDGTVRGQAQVPTALAQAFVNLLIYDSLALVAVRAAHMLPEETSLYSSMVKYLLPQVVIGAMYELSSVLGSGWYVGTGSLGIFQKHLRDVPVVSLGHAGSVACQATVIPQLHRLASTSWFSSAEPPPELFRLGGPLPTLDHARLTVGSPADSLSAVLVATVEGLDAPTGPVRVLRDLALTLVEELRDLRDRVLIRDRFVGLAFGPGDFALADRYALILAGAAVLGVWRHSREAAEGFLADACWAAAAVHEVLRRLGARPPELPREIRLRLHHELLLRLVDGRSYDLYDTPADQGVLR